jgi:polyether ionophore transport system permease protein
MALAEVAPGVPAPASYGRSPSTVVARRTARAAGRSGVVWGYVFGAFVASTAWSYTSIYNTQAQRDALAAAFGDNKGTIALFGPAPELNTVHGFTMLKVSMTLMVIASIWGLLTSSRLLRGEEDAGRWDLLVAGHTTARGATAQALLGLGAGAAVLWALTALISMVAGLSSRVDIAAGPALFLALALVSPGVMFLAVGAVTSQLAPTRRQAAGWGAVVLGLSYGLRMLGDAGLGLHALTWLSPLGWVELLYPLTSNDPAPLVPIVVFTAVLAAGAMLLAGTRDVGSSLLADRSQRAPRLWLLGGAGRLSARLVSTSALSWIVALAVTGLLYGLVAQGAVQSLSGSSVNQVLDRLGATGGGLDAYLGIAMLIVSVLVGFTVAGQVGAARAEEAEGRLDHLLVRPLSRTRWLTGRVGIALVLAVACGGVGALFTWIGAATQHTDMALGRMLGAGVNAAVPGIVFLGLGTLLIGVWPRAASAGVYAVLAWSLLIELVGGIGALSHWLLDTSVFHHVATAPAVPVDWASDGVLAAGAVLMTLLGAAAFARRDVTGA